MQLLALYDPIVLNNGGHSLYKALICPSEYTRLLHRKLVPLSPTL